MNRIVFIAIWFGKLPNAFPLWVESAGHNTFANFFVITDQRYEFPLPSNVRMVEETPADYSRRAARWLGSDFQLLNPYKLCDLKVLLFHLYPDLVASSTWWGYCDLDVVWGDLGLDVNDGVLRRFEKIGLNAHCSLWRTADYPELLRTMMVPDWLARLKDTRFNYALDEHSGLGALYLKKPKIYLFRHDLNLDPHAGWIVPMDYYHRGPSTYFWHEGKLVWRVFANGGYYDTHHSYLHFQKQRMQFRPPGHGDETAYLIRYEAIESVNLAECQQATNCPSPRRRLVAYKRRVAFAIRNRLRGGDRQRVAL